MDAFRRINAALKENARARCRMRGAVPIGLARVSRENTSYLARNRRRLGVGQAASKHAWGRA
jgi:hypothetical protein